MQPGQDSEGEGPFGYSLVILYGSSFLGGFEPHGFRDPQEFLFPQTKMRLIRPGAWLRGLQAEGPGKENRIMSREPRKRHQ